MSNFLKYSPPKMWKRVIVILAVLSIGAYITFMGLYYLTSEPSFCASCHEIKPYVASWSQASHNEVKCLFCHEFRGFVGKLHSKSRGLNYVYQHWTGQYTIITYGMIFEQNCIACHLGDYWNYPKTKRLNMKHYEFIKENKSCIQCHNDVAHNVDIFSRENFETENK